MPRYVLGRSSWRDPDVTHRCSMRWCHEPAVAMCVNTAHRYDGTMRSWSVRRFVCARHAEEYQLVRRRDGWWFRYNQAWPLVIHRHDAVGAALRPWR